MPDRLRPGISQIPARSGRQLIELAQSPFPVIRTEVNEQNTRGVGFRRYMGFREIGRSDTDGQVRPHLLLRLERAC